MFATTSIHALDGLPAALRIALVSDIHGNLAALEAVAADIRRRGADRVVNLGDSLSGPLLPRETAAFLMASDWLGIAGNHERQLLAWRPGPGDAGALSADGHARSMLGPRELAWLGELKPALRLGDQIRVCHGSPRSDVEYFLETVDGPVPRLANAAEIAERLGPETAPVVVCGHTHLPRVVGTAAGQLLVNPGSVGLPAYADAHPRPHVVETGSPLARYAMLERTPAGWTACLLSLPYDHAAMAALAEAHGRPDWAHALRTGYVLPEAGGRPGPDPLET